MSRRLKTALFLLGSTLFNVFLLYLYWLAFHGILALFLPDRRGLLAVAVWLGLIIATLAYAWFTYRAIYRLLSDRFDFKKYFDLDIFKQLF